jgi:ubiquinone/menaquinone biosynthesis C-methylase UbiE
MSETWNSTEKFNREALEWDNDPRRKALAKAVAEALILKTSPQKTMHALETGCGTGLVTLEIAPLVQKLTAVDTSPEMLKILQDKILTRKIDNIETICLDISSAATTFEPEQLFDFVYSSMTLHHIRDTTSFLKQISAILASGGTLAIVDLESEDGLFHDDPTEEVHHGFEYAELSTMLESAGLHCTSFDTIYIIRKKNGADRTAEYPIFLCTAKKA